MIANNRLGNSGTVFTFIEFKKRKNSNSEIFDSLAANFLLLLPHVIQIPKYLR